MPDKKQKLAYMQELIRKANQYLDPQGVEDYEYLYRKDLRDRLYGKYPKCFLKIHGIGRDLSPYLLPICNRSGIVDPNVISIAIKTVKKFMDEDEANVDVNSLTKILTNLQRMHSVYSKDIPKPPEAAGYKGNATKMMNKITSYLDVFKGN
jgi:hypothetical protein